jgi:RNA polymerase primary sigma factor
MSEGDNGDGGYDQSLDAIDLMELSALSAQVSAMASKVEALDKAAGAGPTAAELARLESSLIDDEAANASEAIPEREKLTKTSSSSSSLAAKKTTRRRRRAVASSMDDDGDATTKLVEAESGVVTDGLAARSARARAVARGVRSRPPKESVASMVQTQAKERVRGVNLQPRKVSKPLNGASRVGSTDSMRSYLKDIGSVTLLNANQEVELAKRIQDLMHLEGIRANLAEECGPEEDVSDYQWAEAAGLTERALHQRLRDGKAAKNEMIQANLRLVVSIAKKYSNSNMSFQDLIQEGCVGLIRGAEKFDFQRGYKFSTYAHWWIRQAVTRSISDQSRTIRLPVHLFEIISRISKMEQKFAVMNGRDPTVEEIAEELEMSAEKITQIKKAAQAPVSLAQCIGSDDARTVEDTLVDVNGESPEKVSGKSLLKEDLENVLNTLNPRERDVLRLRYGLDDGRVKTLEEIGTVFSVTRERIRQIEAKALRKLKQPSRNSILQEYFSESETSAARKPPSP